MFVIDGSKPGQRWQLSVMPIQVQSTNASNCILQLYSRCCREIVRGVELVSLALRDVPAS